MRELNSGNFGRAIAYLLPGFVTLSGRQFLFPSRTHMAFSTTNTSADGRRGSGGIISAIYCKTNALFETLVRHVARLEGIDESTLGQKGKVGIFDLSVVSTPCYCRQEMGAGS